ncbi:MAG: adenylate/guanylate cyclase domain-containing protein [Burkholderiales bacterium]
MENNRQTTVLFADVSGSTKLYESAGDAAATDAIGRCMARLRKTAESAGGRVVKTIGDAVLVVFPGPDAAAGAAAEMQGAIETLPMVGDTKIGLRIAFHCGPVIQREDDVFGDTVNLAARLVQAAVKGQIVTSGETSAMLGPVFRSWARTLYSIQVKGKTEEISLSELVWRHSGDMTQFGGVRAVPRPQFSVLRLKYQGKETARRREKESVTIGRDQGCGLVVNDSMASRQHCTIERRHDKFVLADHSTNGTYVTAEGDTEILLQREEFTLRRHGWISLGHPRAEGGEEFVEYNVD